MRIQYDNFASEIFEVKIGNVLEIESGKNICDLLMDAKKDAYHCLIAKIAMDDSRLKEIFHECGFADVNTQITYKLCTEKISKVSATRGSLVFREATKNDKLQVADIAKYSFKLDQFHADINFKAAKSDFFYKQWAINSCEGYADKVFVISDRNSIDEIYAFITIHFSKNESVRVGLAAVREEKRNKGIFTYLLVNTLKWCKQNEFSFLFYGTQGKNFPIIKTMEKLGGNIVDEDCVMHLFLK